MTPEVTKYDGLDVSRLFLQTLRAEATAFPYFWPSLFSSDVLGFFQKFSHAIWNWALILS